MGNQQAQAKSPQRIKRKNSNNELPSSPTTNKNSNTINLDLKSDIPFSDTQSYNGQVSDASSVSKSDANSQTTSTSSPIDSSYFTFWWKEEGSDVQIIGEFCNWEKPIAMKKDTRTNFFYYRLVLGKGFHQFKFIVDGVCRISKEYQTILNPNGDVNNIIEVSKTDKQKKHKEYDKRRPEYNCYFPERKEMNNDAPHTPFHYSTTFNMDLNSNQNVLGKSKFLVFREKNLLSENNSFKKILICPHINL